MPDNILQLQIDVRNDAANVSIRETNAALGGIGPAAESAGRRASGGIDRMGYSTKEAREAMRGLGEEIGLHIPRFISSFVTQLGGVGPALAGAFSAVAVVGMIQVVSELPDVFDKLIGKITGWDETAKKAYDHFADENRKAIGDLESLREKQEAVGLIGLKGTSKLARERELAQGEIVRATERMAELQRENSKLASEPTQVGGLNWLKTAGDAFFYGEHNLLRPKEEVQKDIERNEKELAELKAKLSELRGVKVPTIAAETAKQEREDAEATAKKVKQFGEEVVKARALASLDAQKILSDETKFRIDSLAGRSKAEKAAVDDLVAIERDASLVGLDEYQKKIQQMGFADEDRVAHLRESFDKQLITEKEFKAELSNISRISAGEVSGVLADKAKKEQEEAQRHYKGIFDTLKHEAGGVFDALLTKSQSAWSAIGNSLKTALLTAIKDVVTSRIAASLVQMFYGTSVSFGQGGLGVGGTPSFGTAGTAAAGVAVSALASGGWPTLGGFNTLASTDSSAISSLGRIVGGPGGTSGFTGPVGSMTSQAASDGSMMAPGGAGGGSGAGSLFGLSGFRNMLPGIKNLFGIGKDIVGPNLSATMWNSATVGQKFGSVMGSKGVGMIGAMIAMDGLKRRSTIASQAETGLGAGLLGNSLGGPLVGVGAGLLGMGLKRGGVSGMFMDAAGGAAIGFQYGGPIGAAIGAAAGFIAGGIRMIVGTETEHIRSLIKSKYGVDIKDQSVLEQIKQIAHQRFGGMDSLAIESPEVRQLVQLYGYSTGQNGARMPKVMTSSTLVESGGSTYQLQGSVFGNLQAPSGGSLSTIGLNGYSTAANPGTTVLQLDGPATTSLLSGQAVAAIQNNPTVVQSASISAMNSNSNRLESLALMTSPGTLVS